jgi:hypothetical protein
LDNSDPIIPERFNNELIDGLFM